MKRKKSLLRLFYVAVPFILWQCAQKKTDSLAGQPQANETNAVLTTTVATDKASFGEYASQIEYGEHLVLITGCHDCHTPKKMGPQGPELDMSLMLSGHPAQMPSPDVNRKELESKGIAATSTLTAWVGPWGISYAANLTPDESGIGNWEEDNLFRALREGKFKGLPDGRTLLPPMPWEMFKNMSDNEVKAIFAYLKSIKPIKNIVPASQPPVTAM
jgi:mono/diheme cytochrome c family protein